MKNIINSILIGTAVLGLSACSLHDDTELFDEPAAERLEKNVAADKTLLESASNGWELHLWTGKDYSGGGYTYFMKFANDKVTVSSDIAPANMKTTSSYDVISDQGPVLTVNTYNEIFHYLAEPSMEDDDGEQQDYEFTHDQRLHLPPWQEMGQPHGDDTRGGVDKLGRRNQQNAANGR